MLRLTALLGRPVVDGAGAALGELDDLGVVLDAEHPPVIAARMRGRQAPTLTCALARLTADELVVVGGPAHRGDLLYLRRHVLDAQVLTLDGHRLLRVGDVFLAEEGEGLALTGVEVGIAPVLRRLGLARFLSGGPDEILDWRELHLASAPGHVLQLGSKASGVHRLTPPELEALASALPAARAHELRRHFKLPSRPHRRPARRRGSRFGSVLRARTRAPR